VAAFCLLVLAGGLILAFDFARGDNAGADAIAYWNGARTWLAGGDPYVTVIDPTQASGHILPYAYPVWTLILFMPWALLPWGVAWFLWRWLGVLLFVVTVGWAYRRRPLGTAVIIAMLGPAIAANFDTGNINIFIVVAIFAAQFVGARLGGVLWAISTALKWLPGVLLLVLKPNARRYGLAWAAVPWLWAQPWRPWWLQSSEVARHWRERPPVGVALRRFVGVADA
jgi:hypothetical protein